MTLRTYQLRVRSADDSLRLERRKARRLKAGELGGDTRCKEPEGRRAWGTVGSLETRGVTTKKPY